VSEATYRSGQYGSLDEIVDGFVRERRLAVDHACFGVAGPVLRGMSVTPNLAWIVDASSLARGLRLPTVELINDLEANAYGIEVLGPADVATLAEGDADAGGNAAIIAAGTGLGEAVICRDGDRSHPFATEGGHADFAPRNALESELLEYLRARYDRVSYERVLSGPGLRNIYGFLRDTGRGEEPAWLRDEMHDSDHPAVIARAALARTSELCVRALDLFCSLYGAEAGNLALKAMATGGLYIGGGIAPKLLGALRQSGFMEAFAAKGRMRPLLEAVPVRVILNDRAALLGAARHAAFGG